MILRSVTLSTLSTFVTPYPFITPKALEARSGRSTSEVPVHRFRAVLHVHLLVDAVDVLLDGAHGDAQPVADLLVQEPLRQQLEHAAFPFAQGHIAEVVPLLHG